MMSITGVADDVALPLPALLLPLPLWPGYNVGMDIKARGCPWRGISLV